MSKPNDGSTVSAEGKLRRLLERIGGAVDRKLSGETESGLSAAELSRIETQLEQAIESGVVADSSGQNVAPNLFRVSMTYEQASKLGKAYLEALSDELETSATEFINNRRFRTRANVRVEVVPDVLAKSTTVRAVQSEGNQTATGTAAQDSNSSPMTVVLTSSDQTHTVSVKPGGNPVNIGRSGSCGIWVDDDSVSRLHAAIGIRDSGEVVISDLGSANGTWVNSQVVNTGEARKVAAGDRIRIGDVELKVARCSTDD